MDRRGARRQERTLQSRAQLVGAPACRPQLHKASAPGCVRAAAEELERQAALEALEAEQAQSVGLEVRGRAPAAAVEIEEDDPQRYSYHRWGVRAYTAHCPARVVHVASVAGGRAKQAGRHARAGCHLRSPCSHPRWHSACPTHTHIISNTAPPPCHARSKLALAGTDATRVEEELAKMARAGLPPGPRAYHALVFAHVKSGTVEGALEAIRREVKSGACAHGRGLDGKAGLWAARP